MRVHVRFRDKVTGEMVAGEILASSVEAGRREVARFEKVAPEEVEAHSDRPLQAQITCCDWFNRLG